MMKTLFRPLKSMSLALVILVSGTAISPAAFADKNRTWDRDHRSARDYSRDYDRHRTPSRTHNDNRKQIPRYDHDRWVKKYPRNYPRYYYPRPYNRDWHHRHYRDYFPLSDFIKFFAIGLITYKILDVLTDDQRRKHEEAMSRAMDSDTGTEITWEDEDATGSVKTTRQGVNTYGHPCREFQQTVTIGGKTEQAYGTACRQPDGTWQLVQ